MSDLTSPPATGIMRDSSSAAVPSPHTHMVTLRQAELMQIQNGQTVTKETAPALSHSHTFTFSKSGDAAAGQ